MLSLKTNKKDEKMNTLVVETNEFVKDAEKRKQILLDSAIASFKLEGINISEEFAKEISKRVEKDLRKYI